MPIIKFLRNFKLKVHEDSQKTVIENVTFDTEVEVQYVETSATMYKSLMFGDGSIAYDVPVDYFEELDDNARKFKLENLTELEKNFLIHAIDMSYLNGGSISSKLNITEGKLNIILEKMFQMVKNAKEV